MNFQDLPLDVHQAIASHLGIEDIVLGYLTTSKVMRAIAVELSKRFKHNQVDVMITGLHKSGTSTIFRELAQKSLRLNWFSAEGTHAIYKIDLGSGCHANIFHPNTYRRSRLGSNAVCGITQCVVIVVPVNNLDTKAFRELIWPLYALSGHTNFIFVINKLDLLGTDSEDHYSNACKLITEECQSLSQSLAQSISFIPHYVDWTAETFQSRKELTWYSGPSLLEKLEEIAKKVRVPVYKYLRPANVVIIQSKKWKSAPKNKGEYYRLVVGYVTDGLVRVGDTIWMNPLHYRTPGKVFGQEAPKFACKVESIQYFHKSQQVVAAGNFIGMLVKLEVNNETIVTYKKQKILMNMWLERATNLRLVNQGNPLELKKYYHILTTNPMATSYQRLEIQVAMCGSKFNTWEGKLKRNMSTGFYSFGLRTHCTIKEVISVFDENNDEIKFEEIEGKTVSKGQKATLEVLLAAPSPVTVFDRTKNNAAYTNSEGRCCLMMNSGAVAIGVITKLLQIEKELRN